MIRNECEDTECWEEIVCHRRRSWDAHDGLVGGFVGDERDGLVGRSGDAERTHVTA